MKVQNLKSVADYRGARGSGAGDSFHELWAVRQALRLLEHGSELQALTLEGLRNEDEAGQPATAWDGVDCGLYFGGIRLEECTRIELEQLKYSGADPDKPWTAARLTQSTGKHVNNSGRQFCAR